MSSCSCDGAACCEGNLLPYQSCQLCPRNCSVARVGGPAGFCGEPAAVRGAVACLHFGEEPPITVFGGSGTIFISGCNLGCAFCQNYQISQQGMGAQLSRDDFAKVCLALEAAGAENINIVTGSHAVPAIVEGLTEARMRGMELPVCWNSSAYEKVEVLQRLGGLVDIWLPDFKTINPQTSATLFKAQDYPQRAQESILFMVENSPLQFQKRRQGDETREKLLRGVIVRHLFLPGHLEDTILTLEWLKKHLDGRAYLSLMSQYTPVPFVEEEAQLERRFQRLQALENRLVSQDEFQDLQDILAAYDFKYLFYQELVEDTEWLPDFDRVQPFSYELAKPVWHWREGFI